MPTHQTTLSVTTRGQGPYEITAHLHNAVAEAKVDTGLLHVFICHTSCSLVIMENADPSAWQDLRYAMDKLVPENDPRYVHTLEGPDDTTSHIKMALTRTSETLPVGGGQLRLGTWQGVFLWEHRDRPHTRRLIVTIQG